MILIGLWTLSTWFIFGEWNAENRFRGSNENML